MMNGQEKGAAAATVDVDVSEYTKMRSAVEGAMTPIMMIDRDLIVTFANRATVNLLRSHESTLQQLYPGFRVDNLIGTNIDDFHARPEHQRRMLADPKNLPFSTIIDVGPLKFRINVTGVFDEAGEYVGSNLEWSDETENLASADRVRRLESAIDGATTALMLCDDEFKISYLNPAVANVLRSRQEALRQAFPGFDVDKLIGTPIDVFHKNPASQRALLRDPSRLPYNTQIGLLGLTFDLTVTGVFDENGNIIGNAIEWRDVSAQKDAEGQIGNLITSASAGDLAERLDADRFDGFLGMVARGVNDLLDAVERPMKETIRVAERLADGDLTQQMEGEFNGSFAELRDALNSSVVNLRDIVLRISDASQSVSRSADEIATGNAQLQSRTESQAQSLQETASSIEEMTATINQNADNSKEADKLAASARGTAEKGGEVVQRAVSSMAEINSSSKKISDIIGVIDEIAFQTNLLALNAAVEAARAGEQGRGFAVVATEVRNLAQRSAEAAKEIKSLISESVEKVEQGTQLVNDSGSTLDEIVNAVKKVSDIVGEIAAASQEQAAGVEQINQAVAQIDEVTQQNTAQVEEATASAQSLNGQARELAGLVGDFDVGDHDDEPEPPRARRREGRQARSGGSQGRSRSKPKAPPRRDGDDQEWEDF